jgi:hypothetical protein
MQFPIFWKDNAIILGSNDALLAVNLASGLEVVAPADRGNSRYRSLSKAREVLFVKGLD